MRQIATERRILSSKIGKNVSHFIFRFEANLAVEFLHRYNLLDIFGDNAVKIINNGKTELFSGHSLEVATSISSGLVVMSSDESWICDFDFNNEGFICIGENIISAEMFDELMEENDRILRSEFE